MYLASTLYEVGLNQRRVWKQCRNMGRNITRYSGVSNAIIDAMHKRVKVGFHLRGTVTLYRIP